MTTDAEMRMERIERLLRELQYEVTRGMMENEIDEHIGFNFIVGVSRTYPTNGVVQCRFETRPVEHLAYSLQPDSGPRLKLVK